ncbi:MAG: hypothetical protein QXS20_06090 [Candidatus Thorarchaeota archaeon]
MHPIRLDSSRTVAIIAMMSSLGLIGNYALVGLPNVELSSVTIFVTACVFGLPVATYCVLCIAITFSLLNPWGSMLPPILAAQIAGWLIMAAVGDSVARHDRGPDGRIERAESATAGAVTTFIFDVLTNIAYGWSFGIPLEIALVVGLPFMVVHVASNTLIFALAADRLVTMIRGLMLQYTD